MRHPITVGEMIEILKGFDQNLPVQMSMNMEYQSRVCDDMIEMVTPDNARKYVLITDTPSRDWDEDGYDSEYDGQPDEAQEWHDFDPDC